MLPARRHEKIAVISSFDLRCAISAWSTLRIIKIDTNTSVFPSGARTRAHSTRQFSGRDQ